MEIKTFEEFLIFAEQKRRAENERRIKEYEERQEYERLKKKYGKEE